MESFYYFEGEALKASVADSPTNTHNHNSTDTSFLFSETSVPDLSELDPSGEFSVDIQKLIEQSQQQVDQHSLFPELLSPTTGPDTSLEAESSSRTEEDEPMPEVYHIVVPQDEAECPGVKQEPESPFVKTILGTVFELPEHLVPSSVDLSTVDLGDFQVANTPSTSEAAGSSTISSRASSPAPSKKSLKATPPSRSSRKRNLDKNSDEYRERRDRNNVAVRKSRDKAKFRQKETESRVTVLSQENDRLQKKVDLLTKELTVLKGLFANVGVVMPPEVKKYFK